MKKDSKSIYTIYRFINKINDKSYIGFDGNYPSRINQHYYTHRSKICPDYPFYNALKKYGWHNFTYEIVYQSNDLKHTLDEMENYFIIENQSHISQNGYNVTWGGQGTFGKLQSEENKKKLSQFKSVDNTERKWYNNGTENCFVKNQPPGWTKGRLNQKPTTKGSKWWNNGQEQILSPTCPEGWTKGMLPRDFNWNKNISNSRKRKHIGGKCVSTPEGVFQSIQQAADFYNKSTTYIKRRLKLGIFNYA